MEPPTNRYVLIHAPAILGPNWHRAICKRLRGRYGNRWKVFGYPGKGNVVHPHRDFQPDDWKELHDVPQEKVSYAAQTRQKRESNLIG